MFADSTPQGCLSCDWGSILQDGVCYPRCEEGQYYSQRVSTATVCMVVLHDHSSLSPQLPLSQLHLIHFTHFIHIQLVFYISHGPSTSWAKFDHNRSIQRIYSYICYDISSIHLVKTNVRK